MTSRRFARAPLLVLLVLVARPSFAQEPPPPDPNTTRLFFGPTARSLPRGASYFGVFELLVPIAQVGVTDRFSLGGGTPLLFGMSEGERPFWITPKVKVLDTGSTQAALGALHVFSVDGHSVGIAYAVGTAGTADASVTGGAGLAYDGEGGRALVVMVGAERRVGRGTKLLTENYVWAGGNGLVMAGVRFFGDRLSADVGVGVPIGTGEIFTFPVVNFVYVF